MLFAAWLVALVSTLGALFIGEVMGQAPCLLCWWQRAFMFPLAVILAVACLRSDFGVWCYALPVAAIGWVVAAYHTLLYFGVLAQAVEPCGAGPSCSSASMTILGGLPLPLVSVVAFTAVAIFLTPLSRRTAA